MAASQTAETGGIVTVWRRREITARLEAPGAQQCAHDLQRVPEERSEASERKKHASVASLGFQRSAADKHG